MSGGSCHRKGYEKGIWYDIKTVADVIKSKEAKGKDASFERGLLKAWAKYPDYKDATSALEACG